MPSLEKLKSKWFLDVDEQIGFPPQARHPGTQVQPYTDGNLVHPILSGAELMAEFYHQVKAMIDADDPSQYQLWVGSWRIEPVKLLGESNENSGVYELLEEAARAGVTVYFLGSGHKSAHGNARDVAKRIKAAGGYASSDRRLPIFGSHHQKFNIFRGPDNRWAATLGSGDFLFARWDTMENAEEHPERPKKGYPTHDVWLKVQGPGVHDIARHYAERWNDPHNRERTEPRIDSTISTNFADEPLAMAGPHSLQLLRTYAIEPKNGYSWSDKGEFTIWASYLNAIKQASRYIYLEDQYFYTFQDPPAIDKGPSHLRDTDIVYQLGEALKRGVDVVVFVPSRKGDIRKHYELQQRRRATHYLGEIVANHPGAGRFLVCFLRKGDKDPIIHSKLLLADDEFAIVGSANIGQRSMGYDSELSLGVVDAENCLVRDLRLAIWAKFTEAGNPNSLVDPDTAIDVLRRSAEDETGRLRFFPQDLPKVKIPYRFIMNKIIDPYKGPPRE